MRQPQEGQTPRNSPERVTRIVPVGTMGEAISLRVQSLQAELARSRNRLGRLAFLTPSCGGLCADREEKRVTHGNDKPEAGHQEQLDRNHPNQRGLSVGLKTEPRSTRPVGRAYVSTWLTVV